MPALNILHFVTGSPGSGKREEEQKQTGRTVLRISGILLKATNINSILRMLK